MRKVTFFTLSVVVIVSAAFMLMHRGSVYKVLSGLGKATMQERTFAMIKPDAVKAGKSGAIISMIEDNGFTLVRMEKIQLSSAQAQEFYAVHKARPFFGQLVDFVTSGPVIIMALEKENAIKAWRDLMGATDPLKADEGTVRKLYGTDIGSNATHGSDAPETAQQELKLFFPDLK